MRKTIRMFAAGYAIAMTLMLVVIYLNAGYKLERKSTVDMARAHAYVKGRSVPYGVDQLAEKLNCKIYASETLVEVIASMMVVGVPAAALILLLQFWLRSDKKPDDLANGNVSAHSV